MAGMFTGQQKAKEKVAKTALTVLSNFFHASFLFWAESCIWQSAFPFRHICKTIPTTADSPMKQIGWSFFNGVYWISTKITTANKIAGQ